MRLEAISRCTDQETKYLGQPIPSDPSAVWHYGYFLILVDTCVAFLDNTTSCMNGF